jgi:hypothetical protein
MFVGYHVSLVTLPFDWFITQDPYWQLLRFGYLDVHFPLRWLKFNPGKGRKKKRMRSTYHFSENLSNLSMEKTLVFPIQIAPFFHGETPRKPPTMEGPVKNPMDPLSWSSLTTRPKRRNLASKWDIGDIFRYQTYGCPFLTYHYWLLQSQNSLGIYSLKMIYSDFSN